MPGVWGGAINMTDHLPNSVTRAPWKPAVSRADLKRAPELAALDATDPELRRWGGFHGVYVWVFLWAAVTGAIAWVALLVNFGAEAFEHAERALRPWLGRNTPWAILAMYVGPYLVGVTLGWIRFRAIAIRRMRVAVRRRGIPICVKCGYDGGDITAPKCPECGAPAGA